MLATPPCVTFQNSAAHGANCARHFSMDERLREFLEGSPHRSTEIAQALQFDRAFLERKQAKQLLQQTDCKISEYQEKLEAFENFVRQAAEVSSAVPELMQRLEEVEAENAQLRYPVHRHRSLVLPFQAV